MQSLSTFLLIPSLLIQLRIKAHTVEMWLHFGDSKETWTIRFGWKSELSFTYRTWNIFLHPCVQSMASYHCSLWRLQNEFALKTWVNWQKILFFFWSSMNESQQLNVSMVLFRWSVAKNLRKIHSFFIWHELTDLKQSVWAFFHCQLCDKNFRGKIAKSKKDARCLVNYIYTM